MLNCLLIKKMESCSELDLYNITVICHGDGFERYVLLPVFLQMMLGWKKASTAARLFFCFFISPDFYPRVWFRFFFSALFLSVSGAVLPGWLWIHPAPSSQTICWNCLQCFFRPQGLFSFCLLAPFLWSGGIEKSVLNNGINGFKGLRWRTASLSGH